MKVQVCRFHAVVPLRCWVVPEGTEPTVRAAGGGWCCHPGSRKPRWLPGGTTNASRAWCLTQSLFLGGSWQTSDFFWFSLLNVTGFNSAVWRGAVPEFTTKETSSLSVQVCLPLLGTHKCLEMRYPRDTETAFWPAALSVLSLAITPGKSGAFCLPHCSVKAPLWAARPRLALPGGYRSTCVVWIA